jgi:hypothetical protein
VPHGERQLQRVDDVVERRALHQVDHARQVDDQRVPETDETRPLFLYFRIIFS